MFEEKQSYSSPFYLFRSSEDCWKCGTPCRVVALASGEEDPFVLIDIRAMPEEFLLVITAVQPNYEKRYSKMADSESYMNTCPCGAHFTDFFLYCEPGGAFFPTEEDEASRIEVIEIPLQGSFEIECSPGMGTGELILECGKRLPWDAIK